MVLFHGMNQKTMKNFYINFVQKHLHDFFPHTVSNIRFVELMQQSALPMTIFLKLCCLGDKGYISVQLTQHLFDNDIHLFTTIKKNYDQFFYDFS